MTIAAVAHRGFNLLATAVLALGGLTFGAVFFQENDALDRVDDGGFLLIALVVLAWYGWRRNRYSSSAIPLWIAAVAVVVQILGLILERDDPTAFGDNIGGALYFGLTLALLAVEWLRTRRLATAPG